MTDIEQPKQRLECRTCPFQFILEKHYMDHKDMRKNRKEVEDVMGDDGWENVDQTTSEFWTLCASLNNR